MGIPLDVSLARTMNPHALQLFRSYLDQIEIEGRLYFGKELDAPMNLEQIEQCQAHVMSLFKRLMPHATLPIPLCYAVPS